MSLNRKMRRQAQRASEKNANVFKRSRFNEQPENGQEDESFIKNMLGSISKSPFMKKVLLNAIGLTLMAAPAGYAAPLTATTITPVGNHTNVDILQNKIYNITTGPRQQLGDGTALNAFSKFELQNGDIANFFTAGYSKKILNFVQDKVNIEGIVNSIEALNNNQNKIGGQLYFLSSNGVVIGSTGVVNTGSFYAIVPNEDFMNKIVKFTEGTNHPFEESGFFDWTPNDVSYPNQAGTLSYKDDTNSEKYYMMQAILNHDASGITLSGDGQIIVNGRINAKNDIELLAGRTFDNSKKTADDATKIIIGLNAKLMTHANKDTFEAALNLSAEDKQSMNLVFEEDSFGGSISIKAIGYQNEADLTKTGYASGIKTEGELTATNNVEFVTSMATENAKATNHVSLGGTITADGGIRVNSNEILDANSNNQKTLTAKGVLDNYNRVGVALSSDKVELSNATIKSGNKVNIGSVEHSQSTDYHVSVNVGGNIEGSLVNVYANSGIQLENVTANGVNDNYNNGVSGQINIKNYRNGTNNEGKIKVTGKLKSNGYVKNDNQEYVQAENAGNITVDNGDYDSNSSDVFSNYSSYTRLSGKNANVELNEVYGAGMDIRGYDVSAKIIKSSGETMKTDIVAGGNLTLGDGTQQEAPIVVGQGTLTVAATTIDVKGDIETGAINMRSNQGATLKGVKSINGNIGIDNYGTNGTVTINGNVVARKEDHYANIGIYNRDGAYSNAQGGSIAIVGDVEGKHVRIEAVDNVSLGNVTATYNEKENWDDEPGHLTIDGKNVTVAENKKLKADRDININAGEKLDSKGSIEAGTALSIDATDAEVKTTKSGENTQILVDGSLIAHGDLKAGKELRLGKETYVNVNGEGQNVYSDSIVLEGNTESGYSENNGGVLQSVGAGGTDYTVYGTVIKGKTINAAVNQGTAIKSKGDIIILGGTVDLNNTESLGEGYIQDSRYETRIEADDVTANSITANGGVDINFRNEATIAQKVESQTWSVSIDADRDSNFAESKATITGASAHGRIGITAGTVNLNNAQAQLIRVTANKGGTLSNLTTLGNDADEQETIGSSFGEAKIGGGRTYSTYRGIYVDNIEYKAFTGYEEDEYTSIYETTVPTGNFTLAGTITANNGGVFVYNDGRDIILGKDNAPVTITGQAMSLYTQGNITDKTGNNALTATSDGGSLSFRAIGGVTLANTAITSGGWFEVNNWFDNNAKVTISKDITAKTVHIEANKGIEVGNITANGGNITLDNETKGIDYDTKIRRPDNWSYPDGIDEQGKFDWGSTKPTGDIVVNGNLTATVDPSDPNGEKSRTGDITISNGYWSSYSQDDEEGATVVKNVTMKDATGRTININVSSELKAGNLTSTWEEQSPTRMESRIKYKLDENGQRIKDENGYYIIETDENGEYVYEDVEVENWDRTGLTVGAAEVAIGNIKSNNGVSLQNRKIAVGDVEGTNITLVANEGIEAGNITVNGTKDAYGVEISNENLYEVHYEPSEEAEEIEGGNGSLRKGSSGDWAWTYKPPTGDVKVSSVKFKLRTTPITPTFTKKGKYAIKIKNSSLLEAPEKGEEESSSSSMYEEYKDATLDPNFKGGESGGVKVGTIEGESVQIISDHGISVGQINTEKPQNQESQNEMQNDVAEESRDDYSVNLINRLTDYVVTMTIGNDFVPTLRAEPTDGSAAGSIIAKNGGVRIENQAEGGKITLGDVEGTVVYMKAKGKVSMANVTATKNGDNTLESPAVKPLYIESEGDDVVISGNIEAVGGREIKSRTGGYITPANPETPDKPVGTPEEAPKSQEEAKQVIEDVAGEKGIEEIDRTVNGNQENTDNSSNQEVSQVNDVSSLSDMGSDNIGGFEEMGSDAGGVDVGLSEGSAEFSMGADGSFEVASVGGAEETGSGADAGTASDGGMVSNDGAMAEDNTASNDGAMAEDNTASNDGAMAEDNTASDDGAMAEDNTASDEGAVANDNTDSDSGNNEGTNAENSGDSEGEGKGEAVASKDSDDESENDGSDNKSSEKDDEENDKNKKNNDTRDKNNGKRFSLRRR